MKRLDACSLICEGLQNPGKYCHKRRLAEVFSAACRIVDVPDDLSWALFAYSGAASAAGQVYTGAVLCTPDGRWPAPAAQDRIAAALR